MLLAHHLQKRPIKRVEIRSRKTVWMKVKSHEKQRSVYSTNFDANKLPQPLTPSTTGTLQDLDGLFNCLMSDQNSSLLFPANECASFFCKRKCCLRLSRQWAYLYLLLILNKTPDEGQPASTHTLCQKLVASLRLLTPSFQPTKLLEDEVV